MTIHRGVIWVAPCVMLLTTGRAMSQQSSCLVGKTKEAARAIAAVLACARRAETPGAPSDPNAGGCIDRSLARLAARFPRIEAAAGGCFTSDDASTVGSLVSSCAVAVVAAVDPPPPTQSACGAARTRCAAEAFAGLLRCHQRARTPGRPTDPNARHCLERVRARLDGGGEPGGCFAEVERTTADCAVAGDAAALWALIESCVGQVVGTLVPASTTTPTSSSTTSLPQTTTTTLLGDGEISWLDLTIAAPSGVCGRTWGGGSPIPRNLDCGALYIGSTVGGGVSLPSGSTSRFALTDCDAGRCSVGPSPVNAGPGSTIDCTDTGCAFGPPMPVPNLALSLCLVNGLSAPASGSIDLVTGETNDLSLEVASTIFLTGNNAQPCPRCVTSMPGAPLAPQEGVCDRGVRAGAACLTTNAQGLSTHCPPLVGEQDSGQATQLIGELVLPLTPLTTGVRDASELGPPGMLCGLGGPCSGDLCGGFTLSGVPAGPLLPIGTVARGTIASLFCAPSSQSALLNTAFGLPAPGAASLVVDLTVVD